MEHWLPVRLRRHTWISYRGGRVVGLVSIKFCATSSAWHVDCLRADADRCIPLLDAVSSAAARQRVRRVFLRLPSDSPLAAEARRSGFTTYRTDDLYRYDGEGVWPAGTIPPSYSITSLSKDDRYLLFRLYTAAVPALIRAAEGMTLTEWQDTREPTSLLRQHREFVVRRDDRAVGWLRVDSAGRAGCFSLMFGQLDDDVIEWLVSFSLKCLEGRSPVYCIAFPFQATLAPLLERLGFEQAAECCTLLKEISIKVSEPSFMPMRA